MKKIIALFLAGLVFMPQGWAQETKPTMRLSQEAVSLAVVDLSLPESEGVRRKLLRSAVSDAFSRDRRVRLVPADEISRWVQRNRKDEAPLSPTEELKEGRALLSKGKAAYGTLRVSSAQKYLEGARREFILHLPALRSNRDLIDAHLYLGMTYVALKQPEKAQGEFRRVVYLDPTRELSSREYSPAVIETFAKVRRDVLAEQVSQVQIDSQPSGARIYLNGRFIGTTPYKTKLQQGEYFLLVENEGMQSWYQPLKFQKRLENVQVKLEPAKTEAALGELFRVREGAAQQSDEVGKIRDLASAVHADLVFLGTLNKSKNYRFLGQLFDTRTAEFSQVAVVAMGEDLSEFPGASDDMVATLLGFLRPDGYLMSSTFGQPSVPDASLTVGGADRPKQEVAASPVPEKKWYERWWIWPLLVVAGAGVYLGATQIGSSEGSKIVIDNRGNF
ncbi:MAG TPA: PEGA domain-containing protein [Bdellovibrionota bacterium]|nr:PEGA domain-containing protein [Bdellovibrionota bacterium]